MLSVGYGKRKTKFVKQIVSSLR